MEALAFQLLTQSLQQVGELKRYQALRASLHLLHLQVRRALQDVCSAHICLMRNALSSLQLQFSNRLNAIAAAHLWENLWEKSCYDSLSQNHATLAPTGTVLQAWRFKVQILADALGLVEKLGKMTTHQNKSLRDAAELALEAVLAQVRTEWLYMVQPEVVMR